MEVAGSNKYGIHSRNFIILIERSHDECGGTDLSTVPGADAAHHRVDDELCHVLAKPPAMIIFSSKRVTMSRNTPFIS